MESAFAIFGAIVAGLLALVATSGLVLLAIAYLPRFNYGEPPNPCEFHAYRKGDRTLINRLSIRWWFGLSHRRKSKWFIGILRWEPPEP